jgi:hypothetical protein
MQNHYEIILSSRIKLNNLIFFGVAQAKDCNLFTHKNKIKNDQEKES